MRFSRSEPGLVVSSIAHAGMLVAALVLFGSAEKFDDAPETIPVDIISEGDINQVMKGERTAKEQKTTPRADRIAEKTETTPEPQLNEAKKDTPAPPPQAPRRLEPGAKAEEITPEPPKRAAASPPPPPEKKTEPKPPTPPVREKTATAEEKPDPEDAEIERLKPSPRPKPDKDAKDKPKEPPKPRLKTDDVAKLLEKAKPTEKPDKDKPDPETKDARPESGDENAPKSKFDVASIASILSREASQRRAATDKATRTAALGAPEGTAAKLSATMEGRIAAFIHDHYHPCWASALSLGRVTFAPVVEFRLTRDGALESGPKLLNAGGNSVERARGEQALQAVRRCSPIKIPEEFMPYYEEALHDITMRFSDSE